MKTFLLFAGFIMFIIPGIPMTIYYVSTLINWLGVVLGVAASIFLLPGVILVPFIDWIISGVFPIKYFIYWGISLLGLSIMSLAAVSKKEDRK